MKLKKLKRQLCLVTMKILKLKQVQRNQKEPSSSSEIIPKINSSIIDNDDEGNLKNDRTTAGVEDEAEIKSKTTSSPKGNKYWDFDQLKLPENTTKNTEGSETEEELKQIKISTSIKDSKSKEINKKDLENEEVQIETTKNLEKRKGAHRKGSRSRSFEVNSREHRREGHKRKGGKSKEIHHGSRSRSEEYRRRSKERHRSSEERHRHGKIKGGRRGSRSEEILTRTSKEASKEVEKENLKEISKENLKKSVEERSEGSLRKRDETKEKQLEKGKEIEENLDESRKIENEDGGKLVGRREEDGKLNEEKKEISKEIISAEERKRKSEDSTETKTKTKFEKSEEIKIDKKETKEIELDNDKDISVVKRENIRNKTEAINCEENRETRGENTKKKNVKTRQNGIKMEELTNNDSKNKRKSSRKNLNNDGKATEFFSAIDDELTENEANRISVDEETQILQKPQAPKAKAMHLKDKLTSVGITTERTIHEGTPYIFDCVSEVDDRGELLCTEWARGGYFNF
uniref:Uncharacterized protein n=1 Tax=Meloidogyne hapla TaxID=6305 RepID=A0A1I8BRX6_MELHA